MTKDQRSTPSPRNARAVAFAGVLACAIGAFVYSRRTREIAWPLPASVTFDDAATDWALFHTHDDPLEPMPADPAEKAAFVWRRARREDAVFAATGDVYKHYAYEELRPVDTDGAALRPWFVDYLAFERKRADAEFPVANAPPADLAPLDLVDDAAARRTLDKAARSAVQTILRSAPEADVLLVDGGPAETTKARDASLERFVTKHPGAVRVVHVAPPPSLGKRLTAVAIVKGKLVKDVVDEDQWTELLDSRAAVTPARPGHHPAIPIFDAHVHLADDDDANLEGVFQSGGVRRAVVAPLPRSVDYGDLEAANERVLRAAQHYPDRVVPLVMVSPLGPDPAADLERWVTRGARGLKLLSGHDAYFKASHEQPLDDPKMRRLFEVCEKHDLPVLWHVNSHIYAEGFLRMLRDFPRVRVVNPHFGGYLTYAPAAVRTLLDTYPNLYFDVSLGARPVYVRRSFEDLAELAPAWRRLFADYPTRFLWGTDLVITKDTSRAHTNATYRLYRDAYENERYDLDYVANRGFSWLWEVSHHRYGLTGLALPETVLQRLYWDNAEALYGKRM